MEEELNQEEMEFETKFYSVISKAKLFCKTFYNNSDNNSVSQAQYGAGASTNSNQSNNLNNNLLNASVKTTIRLPPISLPTFNGHYCSWLEFRDTFTSLVDDNESLNDTQKFYYLRSSLDKSVLEVIESVEVTAGNYKVAWQILVDRFENKALMVHNHIQSIFEHPKLNCESHKGLRNLYDTVTKHLRSLKSLGEKTESWDRLIIYILANKFDSVTRRDWENFSIKGDLPSLDDLNKFLKSKCEILEKIELTFQEKNPLHRNKRPGSHGFVAVKNNTDYECYYCKRNHSIFKCESFLNLSVNQRIDVVKKLRLCLNCLRPSHPSWKCKLNKCLKCHKTHNTILHSNTYNNSEYSNATNTSQWCK